MARQRRDFVRRGGFRDATLFVIASEGAVTEPRYFEGLKERWHPQGFTSMSSSEMTRASARQSMSSASSIASAMDTASGRGINSGSSWIATTNPGNPR